MALSHRAMANINEIIHIKSKFTHLKFSVVSASVTITMIFTAFLGGLILLYYDPRKWPSLLSVHLFCGPQRDLGGWCPHCSITLTLEKPKSAALWLVPTHPCLEAFYQLILIKQVPHAHHSPNTTYIIFSWSQNSLNPPHGASVSSIECSASIKDGHMFYIIVFL